MFCPQCGEDARDAKYCPECGADLRGLVQAPVCEACGSDVPAGARFCPECGEARGAADAEAAGSAGAATTPSAADGADAAGGRRTGTRGRSAGTSRARQRRQEPPRRAAPEQPASRPAAAAAGAGRLSPAVIWGGFGLLAAIVVLFVVFAVDRGSGATGAAAPAAAQSATPVSADTSGAYAQLVERANGLYDQGAAEFEAEHWEQGGAYFAAAAKVYAAAWKQKATDPNVGTDYATSLFYSGQIDEAVTQVDEVLARSPGFQTGWFNKGNYLTERARHAEQDGDTQAAGAAYDDARAAFQKAVSLGAGTASGQQAQARLDELPR